MVKKPLAWISSLLAITLILGGCGGGGRPESGGGRLERRFDSDLLNANAMKIKANTKKAELIFVGTITSIGSPPPTWSGRYKATQTVTYTVDHTIKGSLPDTSITVAHLVVSNSRHANPIESEPGLSPEIFYVGNKLIVFAIKEDGTFEDFDEDFGTIPYSETNEEALKRLLGINGAQH